MGAAILVAVLALPDDGFADDDDLLLVLPGATDEDDMEVAAHAPLPQKASFFRFNLTFLLIDVSSSILTIFANN